VTDADFTDLEPAEVWQLVTNSAAMPEALRQAIERMQQRRAQATTFGQARQRPQPDTASELGRS
jgi:hypothetical protein